MQTIIKYFIFVGVMAISTLTYAQGEKVFEPTGSISVDVGIPAQGKNDAFGYIMNGLFNGGVNFQYNVWGGLTLGVGVKYSYFIINPHSLNNVEWRGGLHMPSAYGKIGYEKFITERFSLNVSARMGYTMMLSSNDSCKVNLGGPFTESAFFLEPQIELLFTTEKESPHGFSLVVGYLMNGARFRPAYLCMENLPNLLEEDYVGMTRFLSIGFGYRYYLGRN